MYNEFVRVSNAWEEATSDSVTTVELSEPGGPGGPSSPLQFLKDPLALSQPGEQTMPPYITSSHLPPRIIRH